LLAELERELWRLRSELNRSEWQTFCAEFPKRPIFDILRLGGLTLKRVACPCVALPADLLETVLADGFQARPPTIPTSSEIISAWEYSLPTSRSVRARKTYFSAEIGDAIRTAVKPRILILGGGHLREADDAVQAAHLNHGQFVALEHDSKQIQNLRVRYSRHELQMEEGDWRDLSRLRASLGSFDLIYSPSWLDSCIDVHAAEWLEAGVEMLRAGGRLLAANFTPGSRDAGWIEACWNWHPQYRSEEHLAHLVIELKHSRVRGHAVFRDESGSSAYLEIHAL
jgi:hypothetical protein